MGEFLDTLQDVQSFRARLEAQWEALEEIRADLAAHQAALGSILAGLRPACEDREPPTPPGARGPEPPDRETIPLRLADAAEDRRGLPRRRGNPVSVVVAGAEDDAPLFESVVVDRSPDGLSLVADRGVEAGVRLRIRPADRPAESGWFTVEIRSCRSDGKVWVLGCRFTQRLSWSEMRLFG